MTVAGVLLAWAALTVYLVAREAVTLWRPRW